MLILGLSSLFRNDTAAALVRGGDIEAALENYKLQTNVPRGIPEAAIQYCHIIRQAGPAAYVSAHGDVDGVVANILHAMRCGTTVSPATAELGKRFSKELLIPQMICAIERSRNEQSSLTSRSVIDSRFGVISEPDLSGRAGGLN